MPTKSSCHFRHVPNRREVRYHVLHEPISLLQGYEPLSTKQSETLCRPAMSCLPSTDIPLHRSQRRSAQVWCPSPRDCQIRESPCSTDAATIRTPVRIQYASIYRTNDGLKGWRWSYQSGCCSGNTVYLY